MIQNQSNRNLVIDADGISGASRLLKIPEVAAAAAISVRKTWELVKTGELRSLRIGRAVRVDLRDFEDFVESRKGAC